MHLRFPDLLPAVSAFLQALGTLSSDWRILPLFSAIVLLLQPPSLRGLLHGSVFAFLPLWSPAPSRSPTVPRSFSAVQTDDWYPVCFSIPSVSHPHVFLPVHFSSPDSSPLLPRTDRLFPHSPALLFEAAVEGSAAVPRHLFFHHSVQSAPVPFPACSPCCFFPTECTALLPALSVCPESSRKSVYEKFLKKSAFVLLIPHAKASKNRPARSSRSG